MYIRRTFPGFHSARLPEADLWVSAPSPLATERSGQQRLQGREPWGQKSCSLGVTQHLVVALLGFPGGLKSAGTFQVHSDVRSQAEPDH